MMGTSPLIMDNKLWPHIPLALWPQLGYCGHMNKRNIVIGDCFLLCPPEVGFPPENWIANCVHAEVIGICTAHRDCFLFCYVDHKISFIQQQIEYIRGQLGSWHATEGWLHENAQPYLPAFLLTNATERHRNAIHRMVECEQRFREQAGPPPSILELTDSEFTEAKRIYAEVYGGGELTGWNGMPIKIIKEAQS